jgi:hypothetical protein
VKRVTPFTISCSAVTMVCTTAMLATHHYYMAGVMTGLMLISLLILREPS